MPFVFCPLTGNQLFEGDAKILNSFDNTYTYEYSLIGKAKIGMPTYLAFQNSLDFKHPDLAGICRNAFEDGIESPLITSEFMRTELKTISIPKTIREKSHHLLRYLYKKGGKDFAEFDLDSFGDSPIIYSLSEEEFNRVIKSLEERSLIRIDTEIGMAGHRVVYRGVTLTELGIKEIEKELPKIPLIGLVDQEITTGDKDVDEKINHAKKLFFSHPQTMDSMRSACETLSYVLEPLRDEFVALFGKKDTTAFFIIVNDFDIRHNKESTKQIQYPEQLEWVFYSLLNTINTYTKIKQRSN